MKGEEGVFTRVVIGTDGIHKKQVIHQVADFRFGSDVHYKIVIGR